MKNSWLILLCLLAAVKVWLFAAAFPFFSVTDEQAHIDLAVKYSLGKIPREIGPADPVSAPFLATYGTPEYLQVSGQILPPPWQQPIDQVSGRLLSRELFFSNQFQNHESTQPPLYYGLAGAWWNLGQALHLDGLALLYWLRFLNVPLLVAFVGLSGWVARQIFRDSPFLCFAIPAVAALLPQSVFYSVSNDVLCPLIGGLCFWLVWEYSQCVRPTLKLSVAVGLALAAGFLTKISNLPLLLVAILFLGLKGLTLMVRGQGGPGLISWCVIGLTAAVPSLAWMAWCQAHFGDLTGTTVKIHFLNWGDKPVSQWLAHPLFTAGGFWYFIKGNLATFWCGEQLWHRLPMTRENVTLALAELTLGLVLLVLVAWLKPRSGFTSAQRLAVFQAFAVCSAMVAFFALLSLKYDFRDCFYPSAEHPFFVSGRLMLGMLLPFLILLCAGLDRLTAQFEAVTKYFLLVMFLGFLLGTEVAADWAMFPNAYNWFHN
ncbi:MAG TPA: DUF2142 domain-containing protein [Verrucomicrobiae bacterium]